MKLDKKYYHSIQLRKIQMVSLKSSYNELNEGLEGNAPISISVENAGKVTDKNKGVCYLKVNVESENKENELFEIEVIYKGFCESSVDISKKDLEFYLKVQSVPMLWAYARETINNLVVKMGLPPIILPAVNINEMIGEIINNKRIKYIDDNPVKSRNTVDIAGYNLDNAEFYEVKVGPSNFTDNVIKYLNILKCTAVEENVSKNISVGCMTMDTKANLKQNLMKVKIKDKVDYKELEVIGREGIRKIIKKNETS